MTGKNGRCFRCWHVVKVLVLIVLIGLSVSGQTKSQVPPTYDQLVQKSKNGDSTVDYAQLRMAYAASPKYSSDVDMDAVKKMYSKLRTKDYKGAMAAASAMMDDDYVSIDAHIVEYLAYQGMDDKVHAQQQHDIAVGLIRSILSSGSGTSPASAYKVICVREEYNVLSALGLMPQSQSLVTKDGRDYDVLKVIDPKDKATVELYFDTTISMSYMNKVLKH